MDSNFGPIINTLKPQMVKCIFNVSNINLFELYQNMNKTISNIYSSRGSIDFLVQNAKNSSSSPMSLSKQTVFWRHSVGASSLVKVGHLRSRSMQTRQFLFLPSHIGFSLPSSWGQPCKYKMLARAQKTISTVFFF